MALTISFRYLLVIIHSDHLILFNMPNLGANVRLLLVLIHSRCIDGRVQCQCDASIDAHCWIEHTVQVFECDRSLRHLVHQEAQCVPFEIEQHAHRTAR